MSDAASIRIVRAGPAEIRDITALMPDAASQPAQNDCYAAVQDGTLLGGAVLMPIGGGRADQRRVGFRVVLRPDAPEQAGDLLMHAAKVVARRTGANAVVYRGEVLEGTPREEQLKRCHFQPEGEGILHYRLDISQPSLQRYHQTYERLRQRGRIPAETTIVSANQISHAAISDLINKTIGPAGDELTLRENLNPETVAFGIQQGPTLLAVHLFSIREHEAHTSHMAVDKNVRNTWVYTALISESLRRMCDHGITHCMYKTNPGIHAAIRNSSINLKAAQVGTEHTWVYPLT
jgi:GNAT superfamily N-acetyltransferase